MSNLIAEYQAAGWQLCEIPRGEKGPTAPGWNERGAATITEGANVGLLHGLSGTCSLDLDNVELATVWLAERGVDLPALLSDPSNVQIVSGRTNSAKLLFSLPFPMPSKKIIIEHKGLKSTVLELRCVSANGSSLQCVVPPSLHPSGSFYVWQGDWKNLPTIPQQLVDVWMALLEAVPDKASSPKSNATVDEIRSALDSIDPDCDRLTWIEMAMAVQEGTESAGCPEEGFGIWNEWSSKGMKYKPREMEIQWKSIKPRPDGVTVATLFKHAFDAGWVRPPPDISKMFGPVRETTRQQVEEKMSPAAKVPPVDTTLWPAQLLRRATEVSNEVGCDVVVPLLAGLSAVSAAADKRITLRINPTWAVPPVFWTMTIGEPADKKTPGSRPMFMPLRKLEGEDKPRYEAEMLGWIGKEARYAAQQKAYREWAASPDAEFSGAVPPQVDPIPKQPEPLRLLVNDATSQKLVGMAQNRERGFLIWMDEMNNWLAKLANGRSTEDRGCWIQCYETGPYTMDRVGAGTIHADNLAASIYGNCQPAVFREHMKDTATDGLLQRFLPVVLNPDKNAMWQKGVPDFLSSAADYEQLLRRTYSLPVFEYVMTPEGNEAFRTFCKWCLEFRDLERYGCSSASYQTALGKLEGNAGRLILLCHLIQDPHCPFISEETVKQGCNLIHRFFLPMLRYTFLEVGQQRDRIGLSIFTHVLQLSGVKETITLGQLRDVARKAGLSELEPWKQEQLIRATMDEMAGMNYVAMHQDHPRYPVWAINPAMAEAMKDERRRIIMGKQESIERIRESIFEKYNKRPEVADAIGYATI